MASFEMKVDVNWKSFSDKNDIIGVGLEVFNTSAGGREKIGEDSFVYQSEGLDSTEASLVGIYRGLYRLDRISSDERVRVVTVSTDHTRAMELLQEENIEYSIIEDILSQCKSNFHTVHWNVVDGEDLVDVRYSAKAEANKLKNNR